MFQTKLKKVRILNNFFVATKKVKFSFYYKRSMKQQRKKYFFLPCGKIHNKLEKVKNLATPKNDLITVARFFYQYRLQN